jgi:putative transposase
MARLPRFVNPDQPQLVILRGNNRSETFCADADYAFYLEKLLWPVTSMDALFMRMC